MRGFLRNRWRLLGAVVLCSLLLGFLGTSYVIGRQVRGVVADAHAIAPGDPVLALLAVLASEDVPFPERNRAVWALGQLGDPRAAAPLEALLTGGECDHSARLCQHELEKAARLCRGGRNPKNQRRRSTRM